MSSSSFSYSLNFCCAVVLALASSSTVAQESGASLDLPPAVEEETPPSNVDTEKKRTRKSRAKTREAFARDPDDDDDSAFPIENDGQRQPIGNSRTDDVGAGEFAEDDSKGMMASTLIPGFIGFSLGAALPATILAAGVAGIVMASSAANADPNTETGMLFFTSLGCAGCGVLTIGPAGTIGSVAGAWIGATINNRTTRFAASGAAAGTFTLSLALVSLAFLTQMPRLSPWNVAIPTVIFVLAGPISLAAATTFDVVTSFLSPAAPDAAAPRTQVHVMSAPTIARTIARTNAQRY